MKQPKCEVLISVLMLKPAYVQGDGLDIHVGMWVLAHHIGLAMWKIYRMWIVFNGSGIFKTLNFQYKCADAV